MDEAVDALWHRATLAIAHGKNDLGKQLLRRLLGLDPSHPGAHSMLAQIEIDDGNPDEALELARKGVALEPDSAFAHHALGYVHFMRNENGKALGAALEACRVAPWDPSHHALAAQVLGADSRWQEALQHAEQGLELEAEHVSCLNLRAIALRNLGRGAEASATLEASLARDPENAYTHQAQGWALLHQGDSAGAMRHFQEALRRDATLEGARAGLVEALKARNPIYRLLLGWFLWMNRYTAARQRQIVVGLFVASLVARRMLEAAGHLEAARWAGLAWLGFVMVLSCAVPFFNFLLLLHPLGRQALGRTARRDAILLGCTVLACLSIAVYDWISPSNAGDGGTWLLLLLLFPVAGLGAVRDGWPLRVLQVFCALGAAFSIWWIASTFAFEGELPTATAERRVELERALTRNVEWFGAALWSFVLSSWYVMLLSGRRRRR